MSTVKKITAVGTRGDAKGKLFTAKKDSAGYYVLNKKKSANSLNPTNKAVNKVRVASLDEAAKILSTDEYLINLVSEDEKRALREYKKVYIEYT